MQKTKNLKTCVCDRSSHFNPQDTVLCFIWNNEAGLNEAASFGEGDLL